jgi:alpha-glucosidase
VSGREEPSASEAPQLARGSWRLSGFHHDGSSLYVSNPAPELGEVVSVFVRGPATGDTVHVRSTPDGEPRLTAATVDRRAGATVWWRAELEVRNPVTHYRFLLTGPGGYRWLTGAGEFDHDVPDTTDFRLVTHAAPPSWLADAIVYEIFPDRFARSPAAAQRSTPDWALRCDWDDPVVGRGPQTPRQWYGGDLDGIVEHLDHITDLGANTVYLTPIFPARSNHRYDAASFDHVDPLLGGDAALDRLVVAARQRGLRLVGDITTNHTGDHHPWFTGPDRKDLYYADPDGSYESWLGVPSLPKLDWGSAELRRRFFDGPDSITARWLDRLDGWRVDVANMTGRLRGDDYAHAVAQRMAAAARAANAQAPLIAEHAHDAGEDLDRGGWDATMNYAGFLRPLWTWLRGPELDLPDFLGVPGRVPYLDGRAMVATMRAFAATRSWRASAASWTLVGSHDTARIRTVAGSDDRVTVAFGLLATMPGVPMAYAGDEWGLCGDYAEDARRPMPWHRPHARSEFLHGRYRTLLRLRGATPALRHGGLRFAHVGPDAVAYWRETAQDRVLVSVRRNSGTPQAIPFDATGADNLYGGASLSIVDGQATLPGDGPSVQIWAVEE